MFTLFRFSFWLLALLPLGCLATDTAQASSTPDPVGASPNASRNFDFLYGHWLIRNHRLLAPLQSRQEWEEFDATSHCVPILGGIGNQDDFLSAHRPGFIGMSLRLFDLEKRRWRIYWMDNRTGVLQAPVFGAFDGSTGIFHGEDHYLGRPILVRYMWTRIDTATPHWEQAFSADNGHTWETNWEMEFRRAVGDRS